MCKILLSINPEHVENIFRGKKEYEYRKNVCKRDVDKIVIYSTAPVKKIVGEADVKTILVDKPEVVWKKTKKKSGIEKKFFDTYYKNRDHAVAYQLTNIVQYEDPKELKDYDIKVAPQSFVYL